MIDIVRQVQATSRAVGERPGPDGTPVRSVRLTRDFDAPIDDVWDALTSPDRINRWFLPVSGDFRLGGRYQFEGNAGGEILTCERPGYLKVSWIYGELPAGAVSEVEVRLSMLDAGRTRFDFEHSATVPEEQWAEYGPGAVGVGWDGGMLGLALHLAGGGDRPDDPVAWQLSDEGREFSRLSSESWRDAHRASGADDDAADRAAANTLAFYAPRPDPVS